MWLMMTALKHLVDDKELQERLEELSPPLLLTCYVQDMFRLCSSYVQAIFRQYPGYVQATLWINGFEDVWICYVT